MVTVTAVNLRVTSHLKAVPKVSGRNYSPGQQCFMLPLECDL